MTCEKMNEEIFNKYGDIEKSALNQVVKFTDTEIRKKKEKEEKLKQFVQQADELTLLDSSDKSGVSITDKEPVKPISESNKTVEAVPPTSAAVTQPASNDSHSLLLSDVCEYLGDFQDTDKDLKTACTKPTSLA